MSSTRWNTGASGPVSPALDRGRRSAAKALTELGGRARRAQLRAAGRVRRARPGRRAALPPWSVN